MNRKKTSIFKQFIKRIDEAPSPYQSLLWVILVGMYFLWAGVSPMLLDSKGIESLMPLTILAILGALYFFERPHRLSFLVSLSLVTIIAVPFIMLLNVYRVLAGLFPGGWEQAGFWRGSVVFLGVQVLGLLLTIVNFLYTVKRWKSAVELERKGIKRQALLLLTLLLILLAPLIFFIFAGLIRRGG